MLGRAAFPSRDSFAGGAPDLPHFWPLSLPVRLTQLRVDRLRRNLAFAGTVQRTQVARPAPTWSTTNQIRIELHTLQLRDFSRTAQGPFTLIVPPHAGHSSTIADFQKGQSLVETLLSHEIERLAAIDWKPAKGTTKSYDIDNYLAELNVCVEDLDGRANLIGLCQGGWLSAIYAARFPHKVRSLVLAGSPIDTDAGETSIKDYAHRLPTAFYERLVKLGDLQAPMAPMVSTVQTAPPGTADRARRQTVSVSMVTGGEPRC